MLLNSMRLPAETRLRSSQCLGPGKAAGRFVDWHEVTAITTRYMRTHVSPLTICGDLKRSRHRKLLWFDWHGVTEFWMCQFKLLASQFLTFVVITHTCSWDTYDKSKSKKRDATVRAISINAKVVIDFVWSHNGAIFDSSVYLTLPTWILPSSTSYTRYACLKKLSPKSLPPP